jgi:hypothetical protein
VTDPAALVKANRRRIVVRRIAFVATVPLLVFALLFSVKVLSMYAFAYQSGAAYAAGNYGGTVAAARWQQPINLFEPYKAPFNVGVGLTGAGDLAGARAAFEESLGLATGLEQCAVRVNLAIVIERIGDAALVEGDRAAARSAWQEALLVLLEAPEGCHTSEADAVSPDPDQSMPDTVTEEERRLREKLQEDGGDGSNPPEEPEEPEPSEPLDENELESIQDQLEQGIDERDEYLDGEQGEYGSGTDRPW